MGIPGARRYALLIPALALGGYAFWRYVWFFRNPRRSTPDAEGVVSPADGTVGNVKRVEPGAEAVTIKQGLAAKLADIVHEDAAVPKLVIGVFMSPSTCTTTARR